MEYTEITGDEFSGELSTLDFSESQLDTQVRSCRQSPLEGLSNVDYSLNSPLISDEIDEFVRFLQGKPYRKAWNAKLWSARQKLVDHFKIPVEKTCSTERFHQRFFSLLKKDVTSVAPIQKLVSESNNFHKETWEVPHAFFKTWLSQDVPCPDKSVLSRDTLKYGALWLDLHHITLFLNADSHTEKTNLSATVGGLIVSVNGHEGVKLKTANLGVVYIIKGVVYFAALASFADRNMVLMMKDVTNSRFQSLMSLQNRVDGKYTGTCLKDIEELYRLGDDMIIHGGNKAYDGLKLIEPLCNLRLTELAQLERPRIPLFHDFRNHLEQAIAEDVQNRLYLERLLAKLMTLTDVDTILVVYGSYRHWGHPFLEYMEGLRKLHEQTTVPKQIDKRYAKALASDLAYIVLKDQYSKTKKWAIDISRVPKGNLLYDNFINNTWPTPFQIRDYGDRWDELPLAKCFEIPDIIDPSLIYSDKSHSIQRHEIIEHLTTRPLQPIPARKVLSTFINSPATNWKEFLKQIDEEGLSPDDLVIGLRGKEREVKRIGRFFALMSWKLRDYFVITEYLIKLHFVPLFSGLTMADDLNTVLKKMLDTSNGQGLTTYDYITMANHIDYQKWNNHQRAEANNPVFTVMGKFLGYPNLIARTHEFFSKSLFYYNNRPDLMVVVGNSVTNKDPTKLVCWEGQAGGIEGLRQKGWSIVNLLVIRREGKAENTRLSILAQGDNQVVCTQYKLQKTRTEEELDLCIRRVVANNNRIMTNIEAGTRRLGLIINHDETIRSADYLVYGKVPIYRGRLKGLETKRWARFSCVSNDQLPTLANVMTTVSSNALSVGHFSESPINTISHYNFLGNFTSRVLDIHNPAVRGDMKPCLNPQESGIYHTKLYRMALLYLDPSLGGICGISLTRFMIRAFPDPVTESLAFWKVIFNRVSRPVQQLISVIGSPQLGNYNRGTFAKLLENPLSLNLRHGIDPVQMIKDEIKAQLINDCEKIKNHIVRDAVRHSRDEEESLYAFLETIRPRFPRFLSEYKAGTYLGLTESLVGLFQNSKTIRNVFSKRLKKKIDDVIVTSEIRGVKFLIGLVIRAFKARPGSWQCSSEKADMLRTLSWEAEIVGATVPHPFEMIQAPIEANECELDIDPEPVTRSHLSVLVPRGIPVACTSKGPYKPYLGSKTTENTSLLRPWENEIKLPLIKRAADLRKSFHWFVEPDSKLGLSILNNLKALTGLEWAEAGLKAHRTGSALHRFSCSRQSQGGYIAQSPFHGTWMMETTDTMSPLGDKNYDFLFQALLLYGQMTIGEYHTGDPRSQLYHFHIQCPKCLREVTEITLDSAYVYSHPPVDHILVNWKPDDSQWVERRPRINLRMGDWDDLTDDEKSYHIGKSQGFLFGEIVYHSKKVRDDASLFPLVLRDKLRPRAYMEGLVYGLLHSSSIACLYKRSIQNLRRPLPLLYGQALFLIDQICNNEGLINLWRANHFLTELTTIPHKIPPSYPLKNQDLGQLGRNYLRSLFTHFRDRLRNKPFSYGHIWIFGDFMDPDIIIPFILAQDTISLLYFNPVTKESLPRIREVKAILGEQDPEKMSATVEAVLQVRVVHKCGSEIRHAAKTMEKVDDAFIEPPEEADREWGKEYVGGIVAIKISYDMNPPHVVEHPEVPRIQDPLISGLRLFQCPTGAHYKMRTIIERLNITYTDFLVGGDGSGGMTSALLRLNPLSTAIFNSLLDLDGVELKGSSPAPPSALSCMPEVRDRCVNYKDVWKHPSDLTKTETWEYFVGLRKKHNLLLDLLIFDVETVEPGMLLQIEKLLSSYSARLLEPNGTIIFKTHAGLLLDTWGDGILTLLGPCFRTVRLVMTTVSSSHTSEVYIVMRHPSTRNMNCRPSKLSLLRELHLVPACMSPEAEFERALCLPVERMFEGVPDCLRSDPEIELSLLLLRLGVETGVGALISEYIRQSTGENLRIMPYYLLLSALNSVFELTRGADNPLAPPDSVIYNWGAFLVGFLCWLAWSRKKYTIKKNAQQMISKMFLFSWDYYTDANGITLKRVSFLGRYQKEKNVYLDGHMAMIGSTIRVLCRLFPRSVRVKFDEDLLEPLLVKSNARADMQFFEVSSDIFALLKPRTIQFPDKTPHIGATVSRRQEIVWTSDNLY